MIDLVPRDQNKGNTEEAEEKKGKQEVRHGRALIDSYWGLVEGWEYKKCSFESAVCTRCCSRHFTYFTYP